MGGYSTKRMFMQLLTTVMLLHLLISSSSGEEAVNSSENRVCVSKGGRSVPYELEGKLPKSADLNMCNVFHDKTCCSASQMLSASLALQNLATHGQASKDCLSLFELLECSICHPDVGTQPRPLRICASFCDSVFEACSHAYFSASEASDQVIVACGASNDTTICEKASKLETNGIAFCEAVGFTVDDSSEEPCYGSKSILVTVVPVVKSLKKPVRLQDLTFELILVYLKIALGVYFFAVASVLTKGLVDQRKSDARRLRRRNRQLFKLLKRLCYIHRRRF